MLLFEVLLSPVKFHFACSLQFVTINRDDVLILIMTLFQVIEHQPYDSCCDWWSLGVMLYYMLTSKVCDRSSEFIVTLVWAVDSLVIIVFRNSMENLHRPLNWSDTKSENVTRKTFVIVWFVFYSFYIISKLFNSFTSKSLRVMNKPRYTLVIGHSWEVSNHESTRL